jgi:hypothetical protein
MSKPIPIAGLDKDVHNKVFHFVRDHKDRFKNMGEFYSQAAKEKLLKLEREGNNGN